MKNLAIRIILDSPIPAYRQIVDSLRTLIVEGCLQSGDRLPSVRQLAVRLGVHHNTVAEAYRELAADGWLDLGRRRGATVIERQAPRSSSETRARFSRQLRDLIAKGHADGLRRSEIA